MTADKKDVDHWSLIEAERCATVAKAKSKYVSSWTGLIPSDMLHE